EDREASLSISEGAKEKILLKCHAGCSAESIVDALGLSMSDLFSSPLKGKGKKDKPPKEVSRNDRRKTLRLFTGEHEELPRGNPGARSTRAPRMPWVPSTM